MYATFQVGQNGIQSEVVNHRAFRKLLFEMYSLMKDSTTHHPALVPLVIDLVHSVYAEARVSLPTSSPSRAYGASPAEKLRFLRLACTEIICAASIIESRFHHLSGVGQRAAQECTNMLNTPVFVRIRLSETAILLFVDAYKEMRIPRDISRLIGSVAWKMRYEEE